MNRLCKITMLTAVASLIATGSASASDDVYADFPITLKGYDGTSKTSVSYGGQMARHLLHNGLKKAASSGDVNKMNMYFNGAESVPVLDPKSSDKFPIKQTKVEELSKGKTLVKKTYKGKVIGWPGNMTGAEVIQFMIKRRLRTKGRRPEHRITIQLFQNLLWVQPIKHAPTTWVIKAEFRFQAQ